ncbi:hypothetical protein MAM1_0008d00942 [Mucor ambiguus]|uniref:Uncharacterized protein n=1 Tax=Mucor ambiguus TaxID=91626 RepID=A0A0C9M531_9FUNG|nr:hypothetical protein MAM1_0008d00942 [Mucor ambiguus]
MGKAREKAQFGYEVEFINEQLAENPEAIEETHEEAIEEAIEEIHEEAIEETYEEDHEEADDGINETDELNEQKDTEHTENLLNIPNGDFRMKFERSFDKMKAEEKWYLSNGKCVEDELFAFGMQCKEEHPCHSFIVDPIDTNYQKYRVFNDDELQEIGSFREKKLPTMPTKLRDYFNTYNLTTTTALRQKIFAQEQLDEEYSEDMDWIRFTVYSFVREYEAESFKRSHSEEWYKAHVWHFLDTVFNNLSEIEVLRGEKASFSSSKRKNKNRSIGAITSLVSKKVGSKCDMIFRKLVCNHDDILEFGATETGKDYDGDDATKRLIEGCIKLPKCLKDMLDNLAMNIQPIADIEVVGFVHSGLQSCLVRADRPTPYVTRITRARSVHISSDISNFGPSVLPSMYSAWLSREIVKRVLLLLSTSLTAVRDADSSWLETYWTSSKPSVMPETSTSSVTTNRSNKKIKNKR